MDHSVLEEQFNAIEQSTLTTFDVKILDKYAEIEVSEKQEIPGNVTEALYFAFMALAEASISLDKNDEIKMGKSLESATTSIQIAVHYGNEYLADADGKRARRLIKLYGKRKLKKVKVSDSSNLVLWDECRQRMVNFRRALRKARKWRRRSKHSRRRDVAECRSKASRWYAEAVSECEAVLQLLENRQEAILFSISDRSRYTVLNVCAAILGAIGLVIGIAQLNGLTFADMQKMAFSLKDFVLPLS